METPHEIVFFSTLRQYRQSFVHICNGNTVTVGTMLEIDCA